MLTCPPQNFIWPCFESLIWNCFFVNWRRISGILKYCRRCSTMQWSQYSSWNVGFHKKHRLPGAWGLTGPALRFGSHYVHYPILILLDRPAFAKPPLLRSFNIFLRFWLHFCNKPCISKTYTKHRDDTFPDSHGKQKAFLDSITKDPLFPISPHSPSQKHRMLVHRYCNLTVAECFCKKLVLSSWVIYDLHC